MDSGRLLERCEGIALLSASMLAAARRDDWCEVERLREAAAVAIDDVRKHSTRVSLSPQERKVKFAHLQRILVDAGKIQELSHPWLKTAGYWLSSANRIGDPFKGIPK